MEIFPFRYNQTFKINFWISKLLIFICLDDDDYQLITWSKDQSLRIWRVDVNLQKVRRIQISLIFLVYVKKNILKYSFCQLCGYEPENQPQIVYEENESTYDVSGDINSLIISMKNLFYIALFNMFSC